MTSLHACPRCGHDWTHATGEFCEGCGGHRITLAATAGKSGRPTARELGQTEGVKLEAFEEINEQLKRMGLIPYSDCANTGRPNQ